MREFGAPVTGELQRQLRQQIAELFELMPDKKTITGADYAMDAADLVVIHAADVKLDDGERFRLAATTPEARPPFEWFYELTSEIDEQDYFKHYLVRADDIVLAQRKLLTPIDDEEAQMIMADIAKVRTALNER